MSGELYSIQEHASEDRAVLRIDIDRLTRNETELFRQGCLLLMKTQRSNLVFDLRSLERIASEAIGAVLDVAMLARTGPETPGRIRVLASGTVAEHIRRYSRPELLEIIELSAKESV